MLIPLPHKPPSDDTAEVQMVEFEFMGRQISLGGEGTQDCPFLVQGTGYNPALAAEIENFVIGKWFGERPWHLKNTRVDSGPNGETLAVLTVRFFDDNEELLQTEAWFDVTEAMSKG
jgi:hypothetical protein